MVPVKKESILFFAFLTVSLLDLLSSPSPSFEVQIHDWFLSLWILYTGHIVLFSNPMLNADTSWIPVLKFCTFYARKLRQKTWKVCAFIYAFANGCSWIEANSLIIGAEMGLQGNPYSYLLLGHA